MIIDNMEGIVFRPPSEAQSLILRVTLGCSHNACSFCSMYRNVEFRARHIDDIINQITTVAFRCSDIRRVFLADGNALVLSTDKLLKITNLLHKAFPKLSRITCYAGPKDIIRKSTGELTELRNAGLKIIYLGIESGDDEVLAAVNKGVTPVEMATAGQKVLAAGIKLSAMVILGLGGRAKTMQHAVNTARVVSEINPSMLSTLTLMLEKGTPLAEEAERGEFIPLSPLETLQELKLMIEHIKVTRPCIFRSNHISNLLPLAGTLPKDKELLLSEINEVIGIYAL